VGTSTWNHNSAYHPWILDQARDLRGHALDVGCGDGLLVGRLSTVCTGVTGIDSDPAALERARLRTREKPNVALQVGSFPDAEFPAGRFDLITFVASLHHMEPGAALRRAADLLAPGGRLLVVGLSRPQSIQDWVAAALSVPAVRLLDRLHGAATGDGAMRIADPRHSLGQIRRLAAVVVPGAQIRRALYYRYLLSWTRPRVRP
jgi:SAM-dependent methyltransferase